MSVISVLSSVQMSHLMKKIIPSVLAAEVLNEIGILGSEFLKLGVENITDTGLDMILVPAGSSPIAGRRFTHTLLNEVLVKNLPNDGLAHDDSSRVSDPATHTHTLLCQTYMQVR